MKWYSIQIELSNGEVQNITTNANDEITAIFHVLEFYDLPQRAIKKVSEYIFKPL